MKTERFIISAILILALTNYAYGMGHHHRRGGAAGSTSASSSGGSSGSESGSGSGGSGFEGAGVTFQGYGGGSEEGVLTEGISIAFDPNDPGTASVPEPATMLLLGSGLLGLWGLRKKFRK